MHVCPNNKVYIGITSKSMKKRLNTGYDHNVHFSRAIQKYGWERISTNILFDNLTEDEAKRIEIELIAKYNTTDPNVGYNVSIGGESHNGCSFNHSDETKRKISEHHSRYWKGKKRSPLSEQHKVKLITSRNIKVKCVETGQVFNSITEAKNCTGATHINQVLQGKFPRSGGFHWVREEGDVYS